MKISIKKRMIEKGLDFAANGFLPGVERDVHPEREENWTANYAIFMLDVVEPPDEVRAYFDVSLFLRDFADGLVKLFGRNARYVRGCYGQDEKAKIGEIIVRFWMRDSWGAEVEVERIREKMDVKKADKKADKKAVKKEVKKEVKKSVKKAAKKAAKRGAKKVSKQKGSKPSEKVSRRTR